MSGKSIYWILQNKADVPADDDWLSAKEKVLLAGMKFPKRRGEWRLGRWTAKKLIRSYLKIIDSREYKFPDLEILPAEDNSPEAFVLKKPSTFKISISHRVNTGFCALNPATNSIGCDLENIEERSDAFVTDYFTFEEKLKVILAAEEDKPLLANLIWSAKESVLKTLRQGLNSDTRSVFLDLDDLEIKKGWNKIKARSIEFNRDFYGWWQHNGNYILTIFSAEITDLPIELNKA